MFSYFSATISFLISFFRFHSFKSAPRNLLVEQREEANDEDGGVGEPEDRPEKTDDILVSLGAQELCCVDGCGEGEA